MFRPLCNVMFSVSRMSTATVREVFVPKKALVLTKFSFIECEKRRLGDVSDEELMKDLEARGFNYHGLLYQHVVHTKNRLHIVNTLEDDGIEVEVVDRFQFKKNKIDKADVIITTGGDGTFLMAANRIPSKNKAIIGINTNPDHSVGHLCLPRKYTTNFKEALEKFKRGDFSWRYRQRIRITLRGKNPNEPIELNNQHLFHPECRDVDLETEDRKPKVGEHILAVRALNEVFVGDWHSARVSSYEFSPDCKQKVKLKSSGLTICTGTGSTAWSFNISQLTEETVSSVLNLVQKETGDSFVQNPDMVTKITKQFNDALTFEPEEAIMAYTIREPLFSSFDHLISPRGRSKKMEVRSRMNDGCIVIDGSLSFKFNDGSTATFEVDDSDAVKTVMLD